MGTAQTPGHAVDASGRARVRDAGLTGRKLAVASGQAEARVQPTGSLDAHTSGRATRPWRWGDGALAEVAILVAPGQRNGTQVG